MSARRDEVENFGSRWSWCKQQEKKNLGEESEREEERKRAMEKGGKWGKINPYFWRLKCLIDEKVDALRVTRKKKKKNQIQSIKKNKN
jgi:hypothetical protein